MIYAFGIIIFLFLLNLIILIVQTQYNDKIKHIKSHKIIFRISLCNVLYRYKKRYILCI